MRVLIESYRYFSLLKLWVVVLLPVVYCLLLVVAVVWTRNQIYLPQRASLFPRVCAHKTKRKESMAEEHMPFQENLSICELIRLRKQNKQTIHVCGNLVRTNCKMERSQNSETLWIRWKKLSGCDVGRTGPFAAKLLDAILWAHPAVTNVFVPKSAQFFSFSASHRKH